jgi:hypothetical protein
MVHKRALEVAGQHLGAVEHTMRLENQVLEDESARQEQLDTLLSETDMRRIWD